MKFKLLLHYCNFNTSPSASCLGVPFDFAHESSSTVSITLAVRTVLCPLRWLATVSNTFKDLDFDLSL